jgi:hypothetical protein
MSKPNNGCRILLALELHQEDQRLSARRAAEIHQVHPRTLQRRREGTQSRRDWTPKQRKLSTLEEETLTRFILKLDSLGFSLRLSYVEAMADYLLANLNGLPTGTCWANNFIER